MYNLFAFDQLGSSQIYSFDAFASLEPSQHDKVVGGEALVWSEQVDSANLDSIAWFVQFANQSKLDHY